MKKIETVVVTGAAQGIGKRVAELLSESGYRLFLADINLDALSGQARRLGCDFGHVDISDRFAVERMIEHASSSLDGIDALVNVAAIDAPYSMSTDIAPEDWSRLIDTNLSGAWWCTSAVLDQMIEHGGGRVINVSSAWALRPAKGVSVAYVAAKAGLIGLTTALAEECEGKGILVNAIAPGATGNTGTPVTPERAVRYEESFPLGFGGADPVAEMVRYLLGTGGDWISGAVMNVSGGYLRG